MDNILVTAIGSMSADVVIGRLKQSKKFSVIGCDINPVGWLPNSHLIEQFYQVPYSNSPTYVDSIMHICQENNINYICPLTDPEVDVLSENRELFEKNGIQICLSDKSSVKICRDKEALEKYFSDSEKVNVIKSLTPDDLTNDLVYPVIAKRKNGRSSEGLMVLRTKDMLNSIDDTENYIFQSYIKGSVYTVDVIRDQSGNVFSLPREELLRTSNGAGITVEVKLNNILSDTVKHIADSLNITGCINIEFLFDGNIYYLMDINPRFSAGVGFSIVSGFDFIENHLKCFTNENIQYPDNINEGVYSKVSHIIKM